MRELNFDRLTDEEFVIDGFSVTAKTVFPPDAFLCDDGKVLRDRFFYIVKGKIVFNDGTDKKQEFSAGDIIYLPYNVTYTSYWDTAESGKFLSINAEHRDRNGNLVTLSDDITHVLFDKKQEFFNLFTEIHKKWISGSFGYQLETRALYYNILFRLSVGNEHNILKSSRNNIYKAIIYLENNYLSDVTALDLAEMINVKECMFRRSFKAEKGMSPVKYRNMLRMKKAYEMLTSGEYSVLETAMITNFDDTSYFSRLFKKQFGISPSECIPGHKK